MEAIIIESGIAGSVTRVELRAASFPDQRILRMIIDCGLRATARCSSSPAMANLAARSYILGSQERGMRK